MGLGGDGRARQIERDAEAQQGNAADDLDGRAVLPYGAGDGVDAQGGAERDQPVSSHDADPGRHAAEEPALDSALDTEQIDRSKRHGQQDAHGHADWYDEGVGNVSHGGPTGSPASALRPCPAHRRRSRRMGPTLGACPQARRQEATGSVARGTSR